MKDRKSRTASSGTTIATAEPVAFSERATPEIAALADQVAAQYVKAAQRELAAFRETLASAVRQMETAFQAVSAEDEDGLAECIQRLTQATEDYARTKSDEADANAQTTIAALRAELEQHVEQQETLEGTLEKFRKDVEELHAELEAQTKLVTATREECDRAVEAHKRTDEERVLAEELHEEERKARATIEEQVAGLREELERVRAEAARVSGEREAEAAAHQRTAASLDATVQQMHAIEEQRQRAAVLLDASGARLASLTAQNDAVSRDLHAKLEAAVAGETRAAERAEVAERECDLLRSHLEAAVQAASSQMRDVFQNPETAEAIGFHKARIYQHAVAFLSLSFDRMLALYQRFSAGTTTEAILDAVVVTLATEFSRVVLFKVTPNRLESIRQVGFNPTIDMSRVAFPRAMDSVLARAVASNRVEMLSGEELTDAADTPFGGTPTVVLALPVGLNGEPMAVLYADDADQPNRELVNPELRLKLAELVRQQVTPFVSRIATEQKRLTDLDEYATVLVRHLQSTHAADVRTTMAEGERHKRLGQNIEYARQLFAQRADGQGTRAGGLFEDRLREAIEAHPPTTFSRDLVAALERIAFDASQPSARTS